MDNPLSSLIGSGEGDYNSYNRGTSEDSKGRQKIIPANSVVDFSVTTIGEIRRRQNLPKSNADYMSAVGRYQITKKTLKEAVERLSLTGQEIFSPDFQDELFNDYFLLKKRDHIGAYISDARGASLHAALKATCQEWASVEDPDTPGHVYLAYEKYGNRMSTRAADVALVLDEMRDHYRGRIRAGLTPAEAWRETTSMGPGQHSHLGHSRRTHSSGGALRHGSHGLAVLEYQRHLHSLGYRTEDGRELGADGHFGDDTRKATEAFQRDHGLDADGIAGRRTMAAVEEAASLRSIGMPDAAYLRAEPVLADTPYTGSREPAPTAPYEDLARKPSQAIPFVESRTAVKQAPEPVAHTGMEPGLDDSGIRKLQEDLTALGITNHHGNPLAATGQYDDETRMAVMGFQMDLGLPVSGEPDVATVALADARASIARMQSLRDFPMIAAPHLPGEPGQELSKESMVVPREPVQATTAMPFSDPSHPQHALYADLKEQLPEQISEMRLAQFTAACHKGGIGAGEIEAIQIIDDRAVFVGAMAGFAEVDMNQRPTIEQSVEQAQVFDQQQSIEMNQRAHEMQQSQGMSMSM